jgi:hypothetical protein
VNSGWVKFIPIPTLTLPSTEILVTFKQNTELQLFKEILWFILMKIIGIYKIQYSIREAK